MDTNSMLTAVLSHPYQVLLAGVALYYVVREVASALAAAQKRQQASRRPVTFTATKAA